MRAGVLRAGSEHTGVLRWGWGCGGTGAEPGGEVKLTER